MEIKKLNMLRGIAALIVVVSHYSNSTNLLNSILGRSAGQLGVMVFFILSGFLMSYLYMNKEFNKDEISRFMIARVARVVPLFTVVVLCSYILQSLGIKGLLFNIPDTVSLLSHIALLSGTSILWTIPTELQFYVLFVFLWWLLAKRQRYLYIFLAWLFIVIIFLDFPRPKGNIFGLPYDIRLIYSLPYFFVGVIFGQLYNRWKPPVSLSRSIFVLALLIIPLLYPNVFFLLFGYKHGMWKDVGVLFSISFVFFSILFFVPDKNILLSNRIGDFLGKISYSLYLLHLPVMILLNKPAREHPEIFLLIFLMVAILISYISYLLIENPSRSAIRSILATNRIYSKTHSDALNVRG